MQTTRFMIRELTSKAPTTDGYIKEWRLVSEFASKHLLALPREVDDQPLTIEQAILQLATEEAARLNSMSAGEFESSLRAPPNEGSFVPGCGFVVENHYFQVYRLWSRAIYLPK